MGVRGVVVVMGAGGWRTVGAVEHEHGEQRQGEAGQGDQAADPVDRGQPQAAVDGQAADARSTSARTASRGRPVGRAGTLIVLVLGRVVLMKRFLSSALRLLYPYGPRVSR